MPDKCSGGSSVGRVTVTAVVTPIMTLREVSVSRAYGSRFILVWGIDIGGVRPLLDRL